MGIATTIATVTGSMVTTQTVLGLRTTEDGSTTRTMRPEQIGSSCAHKIMVAHTMSTEGGTMVQGARGDMAMFTSTEVDAVVRGSLPISVPHLS